MDVSDEERNELPPLDQEDFLRRLHEAGAGSDPPAPPEKEPGSLSDQLRAEARPLIALYNSTLQRLVQQGYDGCMASEDSWYKNVRSVMWTSHYDALRAVAEQIEVLLQGDWRVYPTKGGPSVDTLLITQMADLLRSYYSESPAVREEIAIQKGFLNFDVYLASVFAAKVRAWDKDKLDTTSAG